MPSTILETVGLTREFRGFVAVKDVALCVEEHSIHALIGPNGAGKTTCFNLLTKFLQPTRGTISFQGRDITRLKPASVARLGLVRSFQISAVFPHLTALEIATTLALEPTMLLLDEPTAGMTHEDVERVVALIRRIRTGRTILMVEHNLSVVEGLCDRITVLARGQILAEGDYANVSKNPDVITAYLGSEHA